MKHVTFHLPSFLRRVRIHGGEFDSSARAMNRVSEKGSLMTYERAFAAQAEPRIVRGSTIERKQMSTKTTFKRVALVAVAALGFGVLSVAPSNAAAQLDSLAVSLASTTQNTTETLTATASVLTATLAGTKGVDTLTVTASIVSGPAYVQPILAFKESTTAEIGGSGSVATVNPRDTSTVTQATGKFNVYLNAPTVVGTYLVKLTPTGGTNATAVTVSIVVSAKVIQGPDATNSKLYLQVTNDNFNANVGYDGSGNAYAKVYETGPSASYLADTYTVGVASSPIGTLMGNLAIVPAGAAAGSFARSPITISISGPGYVAFGITAARAKSVTEAKDISVAYDPFDPTNQSASAYVWSSGEGGVATITATMAGVTIGTRKVSFIGTTASYAFGTPTKTVTGVGETSSVTVTGADSLGTTTGAASVYAFSSDTSVATVNSTQASTVVVTGVKSGTATITVGNAATLATSTITKTLAVKVGALTAKTVSFSFDNESPQAGEKVTLTVTALDASGNAVGDGARALFSSAGITTGLSVQGATWTAAETVTVNDGKATYTFFAPTGTGLLSVTATEGSATDSTTKGTITGSVTVSNPGQDAATDAANEATDAANAATDAALAAAEAADAATTAAQEASDAVAALSESVTKLIAGLQAQIKSLAAVVAKIAKKVKA
jgi:hypothetical protein